ncbi:hypothetical protein M3Y98_01004400 [Aphelenchoides besseyi]|nr:hypothetical protein M3Y98_01004400 [Aphelenchoides besseyi]KAI6195189.1 hypothetical protein M3Y96_01204500 [Aphelenchoides besseyi]
MINPKLIHSDRNLDMQSKNKKPSSQNNFISSSELIPVDINVPFNGALGFRNMLQLPDRNNLSTLLHYFNKVDIFLTSFVTLITITFMAVHSISSITTFHSKKRSCTSQENSQDKQKLDVEVYDQ